MPIVSGLHARVRSKLDSLLVSPGPGDQVHEINFVSCGFTRLSTFLSQAIFVEHPSRQSSLPVQTEGASVLASAVVQS